MADARSGKGALEEALQQARAESSRLLDELNDVMAAKSEAVKAAVERNSEVRKLNVELDEASNKCTKMQRKINALEEDLSALQVCHLY